MTTSHEAPIGASARRHIAWNRVLGAVSILWGAAAIAAPFFMGPFALGVIALATLVLSFCEAANAFYGTEVENRRAAYFDALVSLIIGLLIFLAPKLAFAALILLLGGFFALTGMSRLLGVWRNKVAGGRTTALIIGIGELALATMMFLRWPVSGVLLIGILVGIHIIGAGVCIFTTRWTRTPDEELAQLLLHPDRSLGLPSHPFIGEMRGRIRAGAAARRPVDARWFALLLVVFFIIHASRMRVEWNFVGLLGPLIATVGDAAAALLLGVVVLMPAQAIWRMSTRFAERRAWNRTLSRIDRQAKPRRLTRWWLNRRMRIAEELAWATSSPKGLVHRAFRLGLPPIAILIAVIPLLGFSWYFNSESWTSAVWQQWAGHRTDTWRTAMIEAITRDHKDIAPAELFALHPQGINTDDYSFIVIGDPGEGDASQLALKDQLLAVGQKPECRFMIVSSDVIYPAGAMTDYEQCFYMPFKGFTKPIYAIPGNHDWFDAIEGYNANFLEPRAARAGMISRIEIDRRITSTTEKRIDAMIDHAARLRNHYRISAAAQRAPFFEIHTTDFSLIAADTGVLRCLDPAQSRWLEQALSRAGRFKMVILGHPIYAAGAYHGDEDEAIASIHHLLRQHNVDIVMAGDYHDFEYYREPRDAGRSMHHFVNGGGGAYLSIGTALSWPQKPAVADAACYPTRAQITEKLNHQVTGWKRLLWFWVRSLNAWPSTPEGMAAAFDYNRAPFFQSFSEVRVERKSNRIRILLHGVDGPLHWRDLHITGEVIPAGKSAGDVVEFVFPFAASGAL